MGDDRSQQRNKGDPEGDSGRVVLLHSLPFLFDATPAHPERSERCCLRWGAICNKHDFQNILQYDSRTESTLQMFSHFLSFSTLITFCVWTMILVKQTFGYIGLANPLDRRVLV